MNKRTFIQLLATSALLFGQFSFVQSPAEALLPVAVTPISAGAGSTCSIRASNDLYCVGSNSFGQLGNGNNISTSDPQKVIGISAVSAVSVGGTSACAVTGGGSVFCWGDNSSGQLGIGNTVSQNLANQVPGLSNAVSVAVGLNFACALTSAGVLTCWGANEAGQLANESRTGSTTPTFVSAAPSAISSINANGKRVCVLASDVYCWGDFPAYIFPNEARNWVPTKVEGSSGALGVALGSDFGCLVFSNGVSCWGANDHGQLGNGTKVLSAALVAVIGISNVSQITVGDHFACSTDSNRDTYCWGQNSSGQLGISAGVDQPTRIPTGATSSAYISAGTNNLCALKLTGEILCVGDSTSGQSGYLSTSAIPLTNSTASNLSKVSAGADTSCAIDSNGLLQCWGALKPISTYGGTFSDVSVGNGSACAVTSEKKLLCWGSNSAGQLGDGSNRTSMSLVSVSNSTASFEKVSVGYKHSCAVTSDGLVYCWGDNSHLQLGSTGADSKVPKVVPGIATATSVAVGDYHSCAQQTNGSITCWGDNSKKQISVSATKYLPPTELVLSSPVSKFALGAYNTCLLFASKSLQCFGDNAKKQSPGVVAGSYISVASGSSTVCAADIDAKVWCFGSADSSKLGLVSTNTSTPTRISTMLASGISVGEGHACAIALDGTLACWGANDSGQLASSFGFPSPFADANVQVTGPRAIGESLTANVTSSEPSANSSYLWTRSLQSEGVYSSLSSQTNSTIELGKTDLGRYFVVEVKQSKWGITSGAYLSQPVGPVSPAIRLFLTPIPLISGMNKVGKVLTARPGTWDEGVKLSYRWYRGKAAIKGATKVTYKLATPDLGKQITVWVTGSISSLPSVLMKSSKTSKIVR